MDKPEQKFTDNSRVKLRDGVNPGFYSGLGLAGMEGWIRKHQQEKYGYQRVYIEWDRDHWAYNGVQNGWTWEGHFDLVEEAPMSTKKDKAADIAGKFANEIAALMEDAETPVGPDLEVQDDSEPEYAETLDSAMKEAAVSEAFFLVAVRKEEHEGKDLLMPIAYHASHDNKASLLCQLQLSNLASAFVEDLVTERLYDEAGMSLEDDDDE